MTGNKTWVEILKGNDTWPEIIFGSTIMILVSGMFLFILNMERISNWLEKRKAKRAKRARQAAAQAKRATPKRASGGRRRVVARTRRAAA